MKTGKTRGVYDKRTTRIHNRNVNIRAIKSYQNSISLPVRKENKEENDLKKFSVFIRKRPIFRHEKKKGDFDVVTCYPKSIFLHQCCVIRDFNASNGFLHNHHFSGFSNVFSESCQNEEVYEKSTYKLLEYITEVSGRTGVIFAFGQTGSGKTYTISALLEETMRDLYQWVVDNPELYLQVSVVEMSGNYLYDLMNKRKQVSLLDNGTGVSKVRNSVQKIPKSLRNLQLMIKKSFSRRTTGSTHINTVSSRTHAIISFTVNFKDNKEEFCELTFVDLAGSERNCDSLFHTGDRVKETKHINKSIMCLKDCIRAYHSKNSFIPYRSDTLTRKLRECFLPGETRTLVMVTISPGSMDTEHTLNTLRNAILMTEEGESKEDKIDIKNLLLSRRYEELEDDTEEEEEEENGYFQKKKKKKKIRRRRTKMNKSTTRRRTKRKNKNNLSHPKTWDSEYTRRWLSQKIGRYVSNFPVQMDGSMLMRISKKTLGNYCDGDAELGEFLREELLKAMRGGGNTWNRRKRVMMN